MPLDPDTKASREQWRQEEVRKARQEKIDAERLAREQGDGIYSGPETAEDIELQSDWERLIATARIKFPAHLAEKFNLTTKQRSIAVAYCLGWNVQKIADASNTHRTTVSRYLKDEMVLEFIKAFNYHNNPEQVKEAIDKELYSSVQVMRDLRDDPRVSASTRADIAKWFWEQKFGKAREHKEVRGVNLRELTEALNEKSALLDDIDLDKKD